MNISKVKIKNYRSIKDDEFEASKFVCIIGENNAGKSTTLLGISLFFSGTALKDSDFYDAQKPIYIELTFSEIVEGDLKRLSIEHRERIGSIITDNQLILTRVYYPNNGGSEILCNRNAPKDNRFDKDTISGMLKGKKGKEIEKSISVLFPEYKNEFLGIVTQASVYTKIEEIINKLPSEDLELRLAPIPTGIDASIKYFLPEPIYIAAVKDLSDEVKAKDSSSFGKLLGILLKTLEKSKDLEDILNSFNQLHGLLNRVDTETGVLDGRIELLKSIESLISGYLKENFPRTNIELEIPKPELKQLFGNTKIIVDDGVRGFVDTKGDGLKRSVTFAILRSYVEHSKSQKAKKLIVSEGEEEQEEVLEQPYIFLFEEPELFLHPTAQLILFEALEKLTQIGNQVFATTHSPLFFSPRATGTFIKVTKQYPKGIKPFGKLTTINLLSEIDAKDAFQIICYENNTAAFFSNKVLLVEGDCDFIYIKEVAKKINNSWSFDYRNIPVIKIDGKSNVKRFKDFYSRFNIEVFVLLDADAVIDGFELLNVSDEIKAKRNSLLQSLDKMAEQMGLIPTINGKKVKEITGRETWKDRYSKLKSYAMRVKAGESLDVSEIEDIDFLFAEEENNVRRKVFTSPHPIKEKEELLSDLRECNIFVLSRGAIESYYPENVQGTDKPTKALDAIAVLNGHQNVKDFLPKVMHHDVEHCELELIFSKIFA